MGELVTLLGLTSPTWARKAKKTSPQIFAGAFQVNSNGKAANRCWGFYNQLTISLLGSVVINIWLGISNMNASWITVTMMRNGTQSGTWASSLCSSYHHYESNENRFFNRLSNTRLGYHMLSTVYPNLESVNFEEIITHGIVLNMPIYLVAKNMEFWQSYMWHLTILSYSPECWISWSGIKISCLFVCVEVLRPSQPNGVMSSAVSLPNHTFTGQA